MKLLPDCIAIRATNLYRTFIHKPWQIPLENGAPPIKLNNRPHKIKCMPNITDPRVHNVENGHYHAIDYPLPIGIPVIAVNPGQIIEFIDEHPDKPPKEHSDDLNVNFLKIRDLESGQVQLYAHLMQGSVSALGLHVGDTVESFQQVAKSGHNGESTTPHLHFGMYEESDNAPTNWGLISVAYRFKHW